MAMTRAQKIRAERQEQLREYLSKHKLVEHVVDSIGKMEEPDADLTMIRAQNEARFKLIDKYLPNLKQTEGSLSLSGPDGSDLFEKVTIERVKATDR